MQTKMESNMFKMILGSVLMAGVVAHSPANALADKPAATAVKPAQTINSFGILDVNRIITESKAAKALNSQMEIYRKTYQEEIHKHEEALRKKEATLVGEQKNLSPNEFEKKRKEFEKQVAELQKLVVAKDASLKEAGQAAMEEIRKAVIEITTKIAQEKGFRIIFPASIPVYVSDSEKADITNSVLEKLDLKLPRVDVVVKTNKNKK